MGPPSLSAVVSVLGDGRRLEACLSSLTACDEILLADLAGGERTAELAKERGCRHLVLTAASIGDSRERGRLEASGDWILYLHDDEVVSSALEEEMRAAMNARRPPAAYRLAVQTCAGTRHLRFGGLSRAPRVRLLPRNAGAWTRDGLLLRTVPAFSLRAPLRRDAADDLGELAERLDVSSRAWVRGRHAVGARAGALSIAVRPAWRFLRDYVLRLGFLHGAVGLALCAMEAQATLLKHARLWELRRWGGAALK